MIRMCPDSQSLPSSPRAGTPAVSLLVLQCHGGLHCRLLLRWPGIRDWGAWSTSEKEK